LDSTIIENQNKLAIYELCNFPSIKKWNLQYKASRDGFDAEEFHKRCDGIENTLTIIKSEHGNIFGGFTGKAWNSASRYVEDSKAFIFSLVNKENNPFKAMCTNGAFAIYCYSTYGPTFGDGYDINIVSGSNANKTSYSYFGCSYEHSDYQKGTEKAKSLLAGSYKFRTLEVEVFSEID